MARDPEPPKVYTQQESDDRTRRALAAERQRAQPPERIGNRDEPLPHLNTTALVTVPNLLEQFKVVPDRFYRREQGSGVFECPCGWADPLDAAMTEQRIEPGGLLECPGCLRIYFMGEQLRAAAGPDCDAPRLEHSHPLEVPCLPPCPEYA